MKIHETTWGQRFALLLALILVAALGACAKSSPQADEGTAMTTEGDTADAYGSDTAAAGDAMTAQMAIDDVSTGNELGADGAIATGANDDDFAPGDTVYVAMEVGDATAGSNVELVWYGPDGMEAGSDNKAIQADARYLNFEVDTTGWAEGTYRGEVWYDNELVNELEINLAAADDAAA